MQFYLLWMAEEKAVVRQRLPAVFRRSLVRDCLEKILLRRVSCTPGALSASVGSSELMMKHCAFSTRVHQCVITLFVDFWSFESRFDFELRRGEDRDTCREGVSTSPLGVESGEGLCPLARKFLNFLYRNSVIWCIFISPSSSSIRGRQLLNCLALRPPIGHSALPWLT